MRLSGRTLQRVVAVGFVAIIAVAIGWKLVADRVLISAAGELTFDWSMPDRFGQTNADGIIDESLALNSSYINPSSWNVTVDACSSPAATSAPAGSSYQWRF